MPKALKQRVKALEKRVSALEARLKAGSRKLSTRKKARKKTRSVTVAPESPPLTAETDAGFDRVS